jgi:hypothetical protein
MQLGMIAANRVLRLLIQDQIQDTGKIEAPLFEGNISFKVRFSYIADEEVLKELI